MFSWILLMTALLITAAVLGRALSVRPPPYAGLRPEKIFVPTTHPRMMPRRHRRTGGAWPLRRLGGPGFRHTPRAWRRW